MSFHHPFQLSIKRLYKYHQNVVERLLSLHCFADELCEMNSYNDKAPILNSETIHLIVVFIGI